MQFIKYLFLFLSAPVFAQQEVTLNFIKKTKLNANLIAKVDNFEKLYYTQNSRLIKKDRDKETTYSNIQLGEMTSVDAYNPLKINIFYRDFNTAVVLDNRLAEITRIDFNALTPFRNATHISTGNDNTIWLFNQDTQQLEVYDYKNNFTRFVTLPIQGEVINLVSNYNFCWALTKDYIYTYSYFGSLVSKTENEGYTQISENNENLILLKDNTLFLRVKKEVEIQPLKLPELLIKQVYFLNSRFSQVLQIRESGKDIIQDRTIYEDAHIFAPNLHAMGLMTNRDFENYKSLFDLMESLVKGPDLLIYLRSSIPNLVGQIHKRGREYENSISIDYLSRLNERYEAWIHGYDKGKLLIIDVDDLNFVDDPEDLGTVINRIDAEINGLF